MADYWSEALPEERRDMVWPLLNAEGLIYDLCRAGHHRRLKAGPSYRVATEQLAQAYALLRSDTPFREVAQQFGINPESFRRLAQRDGVPMRARGEKLTPTQRKLTAEQQIASKRH